MEMTTFFILMLANFFLYGVSSTTFKVLNSCPFRVLPGVLTTYGTASTSGFVLYPQSVFIFNVSNPWSGKFWGRTGCSNKTGELICKSGDCKTGEISCYGVGWIPPVTTVDFSTGPPNGIDIYDISLVDGFNLPISILPIGNDLCSVTACAGDINPMCPDELTLKDPDNGNITVACKSACGAFNKPEYCCDFDFDSPDTCKPSNYSDFFKGQCPSAYSYLYDDDSLTLVCRGSIEYGIIFCP